MNLRPGVDTHPPDFLMLVKINLPFEERDRAVAFLKAVEEVAREKLAPSRTHGVFRDGTGTKTTRLAVGDHALHFNVAFGLRFFSGPLAQRGAEEIVPNFPPGGDFAPRTPTRFGIDDRFVPVYLRTMNAAGDSDFVKARLPKPDGGELAADAVERAYREWLSRGESDILLHIESDNKFLVIDAWDALRKRAVEPHGAEVAGIREGFNRGDQRDHTGFHDGVANLQDKIKNDPHYYRQKIYLPHPAPAFPGEPTGARDDPRYDGGTYMVVRSYLEHLDKWNSKEFEATDFHGRKFHDEEGRRHAIGRDRETGRVISRANDAHLDTEPDSTEVNLGYNESHVLKARGGTVAPFSGPFPPVAAGSHNAFNTQDIRIRRRGANFADVDPATGKVTYGLHFICFQNNIQQTGFEFINNIWLLNSLFRRSKDNLFDPGNGIIEPLEGAYYFLPAEHRKYPGDVFFE